MVYFVPLKSMNLQLLNINQYSHLNGQKELWNSWWLSFMSTYCVPTPHSRNLYKVVYGIPLTIPLSASRWESDTKTCNLPGSPIANLEERG